MRVFVKLGGSFITDKLQEAVFRPELVRQFATDVKLAMSENPELQILIGHGSGSFGHVVAKRYGTMQGVHSHDDWVGFAKVANVASELNYLVVKVLEDAGLPVLRVQPSASLISEGGMVKDMSTVTLERAFDSGLIPVVHGDVAFDDVRGGTIVSTESLFFYLARRLLVDQIVLLGEVDGVYDRSGAVISLITPSSFSAVESALGGSHGTDVTGGMYSKVREMVSLVDLVPSVSIWVMSGLRPGVVADVLAGRLVIGTRIAVS